MSKNIYEKKAGFFLSLKEVLSWMENFQYNSFLEKNENTLLGPFQGVSFDSRTLQKGEVFFALKGEKTAGSFFIEEAIKKGAACIVLESSEKKETVFCQAIPLIYVADCLKSLQKIAQKYVTLFPIKIAAVTGSLGKTSVKDFINTLLRSSFETLVHPGNYNSQLGLPLFLLNGLKKEQEIAVLEMGMTEKGNIENLVTLFPPEVILINKVALVHAENFPGGLPEIALAKGEIALSPHTKVAFLDEEMKAFPEALQKIQCEKFFFSLKEKNTDYFLEENEYECSLYKKGICTYSFPKPSFAGTHFMHNLLGAILVAEYLGVTEQKIIESIPLLRLPKKRLETIFKQGIMFINDSYNAAEESVKAALQTLPEVLYGKKKIAVLGEMLELGKFSEECHKNVGEEALKKVDMVFCLGENCKPIYDVWKKQNKPCFLFQKQEDLISHFKKEVEEGDVVLLKGSSSKQMWKVLDAF